MAAAAAVAAVTAKVAAGVSPYLCSVTQIGFSHSGICQSRVCWDALGGSAHVNLQRRNDAEPLCRLKHYGTRVCWQSGPKHLCNAYLEGSLFSSECDEAIESLATSGPLRTLILDNYDSYTYNLVQLLATINGQSPVVLKNDEISWEDLHSLLYKYRAFHNVVISPGPGSPSCAADIGICMPLLMECPDIPILGVCMGHQALGFAHGAKVVHAPEPVHGRLSEVVHSGHPLFNDIPSSLGSGFKVVRYHSLVLDSTSLPADLIPTAWTVTRDPDMDSYVCNGLSGVSNAKEMTNGRSLSHGGLGARMRSHELVTNRWLRGNALKVSNLEDVNVAWQQKMKFSLVGDPVKEKDVLFKTLSEELDWSNMSMCREHERVLMGISHRSWPHYGVQFHPESIATAYGRKILENFGNLTWKHWRNHSWQPKNSGGRKVLNRQIKKGTWRKKETLNDTTRLTHSNQSHQTKANMQILTSEMHEFLTAEGHSYCLGGADNVDIGMAKEEYLRSELRLSHTKLPGFAKSVGGSSSLFCELYGAGSSEDTFWLDSSNRDEGRARFSFMGGRGGEIWRRITYNILDNVGVVKVEDAAGQHEEKVLENGFLDFLNDQLQVYSFRKEDCESLPFEFNGGFVGYLGYEIKVECGARSNRHKSPFPDASFFLADRFVVVDHSNDDVYVLALYKDTCPHKVAFKEGLRKTVDKVASKPRKNSADIPRGLQDDLEQASSKYIPDSDALKNDTNSNVYFGCGCNAHSNAEEWVLETVVKILGMSKIDENAMIRTKLSTCFASSSGINDASRIFTSLKTRNQYLKDVGQCLDYIRDGESYEICLTTQLQKKLNSQKPLGLYLTLRETNPAPYSAWLQFGAAGPCICCSSPERFLRLDQSGTLEAKPIKGTLPRGSSPQEDEMLRSQLEHSEKDLAENLMIVDLLRNDLGRVCTPGSVHVPSLMKVETYSTVHTMVSTVRGKKKEEITPVDCVRAAFPGGSMTGAPKLRTMEILDSVESSARGIYSGTIGFFSFNNSFDLNIVIRTVIIYNGEASIGAGGAIVSLSDPEAEYAEMLLKTKASVRAVSVFENAIDPSNN